MLLIENLRAVSEKIGFVIRYRLAEYLIFPVVGTVHE